MIFFLLSYEYYCLNTKILINLYKRSVQIKQILQVWKINNKFERNNE